MAQVNLVEKAKYLSRYEDFVTRRTTTGSENFAKNYFEAYQELQEMGKLVSAKKGETWIPVGPLGKERLAGTGRINAIAFHPVDTATLFVCVAQGGVWKSTNSGASWTSISADLPILRTSDLAIDPKNPDIMYLLTGDMPYLGHNIFANENKRNTHYGLGVYKTEDGGQSWMPTGLSFLQTEFEGSLLSGVAIHPQNPDTVLVVGETGCYWSPDGGANWTQTHEGLFWDLKPAVNDDNTLYASTGFVSSYAAGEAGILKSDDFGKTWIRATVPFKKKWEVQRIELATAKSDPKLVYALACDANPWAYGGAGFHAIYVSTNGGESFTTRLDSTFQYNMLNGAFTSDDGGQGRYDLAFYVDDNDSKRLHLGGVNIWTSTNGGYGFLPTSYWPLNNQGLSIHGDIHQMKQHPKTGRIFVCHDGGLSAADQINGDDPSVASSNPTTVWHHYRDNMNITSFYRLGINAKEKRSLMAGAQDNSTSYLRKGDWETTTGGDGMETIFDTQNGLVYTSSQYGNIYELFIDGDGDVSFFDFLRPPSGQPAEWTTPMQVSNGTLYIGYGDVYEKPAAGGRTALSNFSNAPNRPFAHPATGLYVNKTNDNIMYLTKRGYASENTPGKAFYTFNQGQNWKDISAGLPLMNYPTYVTSDDDNPGHVWITFGSWQKGEKVYYSDDAGDTWTNLSYNLPNIPVNCVFHHAYGNDRIYIGTDLGVFYLDKNSEEWMPFNDGLPRVIVSELELDPQGNLLAATFGRGIWEVSIEPGVSVEQLSDIEEPLMVFPNPVVDQITAEWSGNTNFEVLRIIDITGREVHREPINGRSRTFINTTSWLSGQYFILLEGEGFREVQEVQKLDATR